MKSIVNRNRIKVNVNGREVEVYEDLTILQALTQEDIYVPHLCYDIRLERANGNCGLCVVELGEGEDKVEVKSCQTPIKEGMVIHTTSEKLTAYRKFAWSSCCQTITRTALLPASIPVRTTLIFRSICAMLKPATLRMP